MSIGYFSFGTLFIFTLKHVVNQNECWPFRNIPTVMQASICLCEVISKHVVIVRCKYDSF